MSLEHLMKSAIWRSFLQAISNQISSFSYEVIVIDSGSTDSTLAIPENLVAEYFILNVVSFLLEEA